MLPCIKLTSSLLAIALLQAGAQTSPEPSDKYQWLEDVYGERSSAWVKAENDRSAKVLESDPRFAELETTALKVLESPQRLPDPDLNGKDVYNIWHDASHIRGILRRTSLTDYLTGQPQWQTVLDYDALNKQEKQGGYREECGASTRKINTASPRFPQAGRMQSRFANSI